MRLLLIGCGCLCLGIGTIGIVLPLLPTTPFVLLAAACFARSSRRFHSWLTNHPRFGPALGDWRRHGVIRLRAKLLATLLIACGLAFPLVIVAVPAWVPYVSLAVVVPVLLFIWSRPGRPHTPVKSSGDGVDPTAMVGSASESTS